VTPTPNAVPRGITVQAYGPPDITYDGGIPDVVVTETEPPTTETDGPVPSKTT
jgi:hypothetical protein